MAKRTNRVIVVGAGLSGLATALHLRAARQEVTVLERQGSPGGRHGVLEIDGFRFDTGPRLALTPRLLGALLDVVGERLDDWIDLMPLDPVCRVHLPDGTSLDLSPDSRPDRRQARLLSVIGPLFGISPTTSGWYPRGGTNAVARALAAVAEKHGILVRYQSELTAWEKRDDRVTAARTDGGDLLPADALVLAPTRTGPGRPFLVIHLGADAYYSKIAHHNVHLGTGEEDPDILVSSPTRTDPSAAPPGRHVYQVVVPALFNRDGPTERHCAAETMARLEARGYLDLGATLRVSYVVRQSDWVRQGTPPVTPDVSTAQPGRLHPDLANVVIAGSGPESGRQTAELVRAAASRGRVKT